MSEDCDSREPDSGATRQSPASAHRSHEAFRRAAGWTLAYTVLVVIIFGAFVRASLSGDGCGEHWPHCYGTLLPVGHPTKTWIEFTHRATSGLLILLTGALMAWSFRIFPRGDIRRRSAGLSFIFVLISGAIGAALVLKGWVVFDRSAARAITMPLHLVNNYLLVGSLLFCSLPVAVLQSFKPKKQGDVGALFWTSLVGMFLLGATGALSAMGKTAFERELSAAGSMAERLNMHLGDAAHPLLRGGVVHPFVATSVFILIVSACLLAMRKRPGPEVEIWAKRTLGITAFQMVFGLANLFLSAPVWMQLVHLLLALLCWGSFILMGIYSFQRTEVQEKFLQEEARQGEAAGVPKAGAMAIIGQYVALTKPRVISLLLFTTVLAMIIAQGGWPPVWQMFLVAVGGYMMAGAANTFNMIVERDLDVAMERTAKRPTVSGAISTTQALIFAVAMTVGSFGLLTLSANLLSAFLALAGLLFYVFVYTLLLKRRTWQNIVIGGAAGAFPPLVGYAAVRAELTPFAWVLFGIIFFWTPVHFWALAILIKDDYAKAGVPMLPVVKGDRATVVQIVVYAVLTALISVIPLLQREVGLFYVGGAVLLNLGLLAQSVMLLMDTTTVRAKALFKFSMVYLALMFIVVAVDRVIGMTA